MKKKLILNFIGIGLALSVLSCATRTTPPAPVVNVTQVPTYAQNDSLAAKPPAAKSPAAANNSSPQMQAMTNDDEVQTTPAKPNKTIASKPAVAPITASGGSNWIMPTQGTLGVYSVSSKGVNITGSEGQSISAVADGEVLYSGNGLKGYGNLIIIRHNKTYLSAYAYNKANLVKEGAKVTQGQKIATMGVNDTNQAMLHLEVRQNGKPVDPHTMIGN
jgi:lipoprotein NlpD